MFCEWSTEMLLSYRYGATSFLTVSFHAFKVILPAIPSNYKAVSEGY